MTRSKVIKVRVTPQMREALEKIASANDGMEPCKISDVIRLAIMQFVSAQPASALGRDPVDAFVDVFVKTEASHG